MAEMVSLIAILGALLVGAMSPGPSFMLVSQRAVSGSRREGLAAALGMGVGGALFAVLALAGLSPLLVRVDWLYGGLKLAGGAYLIYLGFRIWRGARQPLPVEGARAAEGSAGRAFGLALMTQVSNPKTAVVYGSIFVALLPAQPSTLLLLALVPLVFVIEAGWYGVVAMALSASGPRRAYGRAKGWIDRTAGAVMGLLGGRLVVEALSGASR